MTEEAENEIWFELHETPETKEKYPFDFCLSIGYRLEGRSVKVMWKVENTNEKTMYFSIGGHPAFVCPISGKGKQTDYGCVLTRKVRWSPASSERAAF